MTFYRKSTIGSLNNTRELVLPFPQILKILTESLLLFQVFDVLSHSSLWTRFKINFRIRCINGSPVVSISLLLYTFQNLIFFGLFFTECIISSNLYFLCYLLWRWRVLLFNNIYKLLMKLKGRFLFSIIFNLR